MLVIDISINRRKEVEEIGIVRIDDCTSDGCTPNDDEVFMYKYGFIVDGKIPKYLGSVEHRYGDCGLKLATTVLNLISETDTVEIAKARRKAREEKEFLEHILSVEKLLKEKGLTQ